MPLHTSPLTNGHDDYRDMGIEQRKRMPSAYFMMFQYMPVRYRTLSYVKHEVGDRDALTARTPPRHSKSHPRRARLLPVVQRGQGLLRLGISQLYEKQHFFLHYVSDLLICRLQCCDFIL